MVGAAGIATFPRTAVSPNGQKRTLIMAPSNLGLRPNLDGSEPGTWRGPEVLVRAGLAKRLSITSTIRLSRPKYSADGETGTRIRNGHSIQHFSTELAASVSQALSHGQFPIVIGGDCSILLGCLLGSRAAGPVGLIHVDGHSDFYHPGNYDTSERLGSAAGMDLALVTGRGEPLLALWDGLPLVDDRNVIQIGERDELDAEYDYRDIEETPIRRFPIRKVLLEGIPATVDQLLSEMSAVQLPFWLHLDLDVLDQSVMPAVDSPGSPGLSFEELAELISKLINFGQILGVDVSIYDPDLDPNQRFAQAIVEWLAKAFATVLH